MLITIVTNPTLDPVKHLDFYSNKKINLMKRLDKNKAQTYFQNFKIKQNNNVLLQTWHAIDKTKCNEIFLCRL